MARSRSSPDTGRCRLTETQQAELFELLGPLVEGANADAIIVEIEDAIDDCRMWRDAGVNEPAASRRATKAKVNALRDAARRLREAILALDEPSIAVLQFAPGASGVELLGDAPRTPTMPLYGARIDRAWLGHVGRAAAETEGGAEVALGQVDELIAQSKGGRPAMRAEKRLAFRLARLWKSGTGRGISRQNWDQAREAEDDGPFLRFVREVIQYTCPPKPVDATWLVRQVEVELAARGGNPFDVDED